MRMFFGCSGGVLSGFSEVFLIPTVTVGGYVSGREVDTGRVRMVTARIVFVWLVFTGEMQITVRNRKLPIPGI